MRSSNSKWVAKKLKGRRIGRRLPPVGADRTKEVSPLPTSTLNPSSLKAEPAVPFNLPPPSHLLRQQRTLASIPSLARTFYILKSCDRCGGRRKCKGGGRGGGSPRNSIRDDDAKGRRDAGGDKGIQPAAAEEEEEESRLFSSPSPSKARKQILPLLSPLPTLGGGEGGEGARRSERTH